MEKKNEELKLFPLVKGSNEKWRLVLGGGGAKGCYHVGAWQAFDELGLHFDAISGTSIGALVGAFYPGNNLEPVTEFVIDMEPEAIAQDLPNMPSGLKETIRNGKKVIDFLIRYHETRMDITPLREHFRSMFDYDRFVDSDVAYACMTYNDTRKEPRPFYKDEITKENAEDIIMASAACYPAFPKVSMDGDEYIDGGYADNVPIELCQQILPEANQTVVIDLHDPFDPLPPDLEPGMFYMQPLLHPGNSLDFSSDHAHRLYDQGYLETCKYLNVLPGYLFTFTQDDAPLLGVVERYLQAQMNQFQVVLPARNDLEMLCLSTLLGYPPRKLENAFNANYRYGKLVEALGLLARMDPVAMYDFREYLKELVHRLHRLKISETSDKDYRLVEVFSNLKREELPARLHRMLVKGGGKFPAAVEKMKDHIPVSYTLAWVWYFIEELIANLGDDSASPNQPESEDSERTDQMPDIPDEDIAPGIRECAPEKEPSDLLEEKA